MHRPRQIRSFQFCRFLTFGEGFAANVVEVLQGFGIDAVGRVGQSFRPGKFYFRQTYVLYVAVAPSVIVFHRRFQVGIRCCRTLLDKVLVCRAVSAEVSRQVTVDEGVGSREVGFENADVHPHGNTLVLMRLGWKISVPSHNWSGRGRSSFRRYCWGKYWYGGRYIRR